MPGTDLPQRFLICRMSAIGDTILTTPLLNALRARFPQAYIAWVVEERAAPVLQGHAGLDELIVLPRLWFQSLRQVRQARQRLLPLKIDVAIDAQGLTKSALAAWLSGARRRIGRGGEDALEFSSWLNNVRIPSQRTHVAERLLDLLGPLGIENPPIEFRLPVDPAAEASADRLLKQCGLDQGFVALNPGAAWESKRWPFERYAETARRLHREQGLRSLVIGGSELERQRAEQIVALTPHGALLAPKVNLPELASLLRRASLCVSSDTGPMHLAAAVGTPCVALFGASQSLQTGPYGPSHILLQKCYVGGSRRERRTADNSAMCLIGVDEVCQACDTLLRRRRAA